MSIYGIRHVYVAAKKKLYKGSRMRATPGSAIRALEYELARISARNVLLHTGHRSIRNDGKPYATSNPDHPEITLEYQRYSYKGGQVEVVSYALFSGQYSSYAANLQALAKTLEALRSIDRWGITSGQQYEGFRKLPPPEPEPVDTPRNWDESLIWLRAALTRVFGDAELRSRFFSSSVTFTEDEAERMVQTVQNQRDANLSTVFPAVVRRLAVIFHPDTKTALATPRNWTAYTIARSMLIP